MLPTRCLCAAMLGLVLICAPAVAADSLEARVHALEPNIEDYPPHFAGKDEHDAVLQRYQAVKSELDAALAKTPDDAKLLFLRGHLQSMGHNMDVDGAFEGASADLERLIRHDQGNVPALVELGQLWVNARPDLAPRAEGLFRAAQCFHGSEPLEEAQRGLFFALYYQGRMDDALTQARFLHRQWPQVESYARLEATVRSVLHRNEKDDVKAPPPAMASCHGPLAVSPGS